MGPIELMETFNIDLKVDSNTKHVLYNGSKTDKDKETCCKLEAKIILRSLEEYKKITKTKFGICGTVGLTHSQYMRKLFYSKYYNPNNYPLYPYTQPVYEFIYRSYGSALTFVPKQGSFTNVRRYQLCDMSSWAMAQPMPYGKSIHITPKAEDNSSAKAQVAFLEANPGWYRCMVVATPLTLDPPYLSVEVNDNYVPCYLHNYDGLIYTSVGLLYAISLGYTLKIKDGITQKVGRYMQEFFTAMEKYRLVTDEHTSKVTSFMYHSSAGTSHGFSDLSTSDCSMIRTYGSECVEEACHSEFAMYNKLSKVNGIYITTGDNARDTRGSNIGIASFVAEYIRMKNHNLIMQIQSRGYEVHLLSPFGVFTNCCIEAESDQTPLKSVLARAHGYVAGDLRRVDSDKEIEELIVVGPNLYSARMKTKTGRVVYNSRVKGVNLETLKKIGTVLCDDMSDVQLEVHSACRALTRQNAISFTYETVTSKPPQHMYNPDRCTTRIVSNIVRRGVLNEDTGVIVPYYIQSNIINQKQE
jgi:hypothetical protein